MSAKISRVGELHELVTEIMISSAKAIITEMEMAEKAEIPFTPSPQLLQSMTKFLRDNDITADEDATREVSAAIKRLTVHSGRGSERLSNG